MGMIKKYNTEVMDTPVESLQHQIRPAVFEVNKVAPIGIFPSPDKR